MSDILTRLREIAPAVALAVERTPAEVNPEQLKAMASQSMTLEDFGPDYFEEGLQRLCHSANTEADLNPLGRFQLISTCKNYLENRLLPQAMRQRQAEELKSDLLPPLIVSGLPRTGTTFFHRLLASDPAHVAIPYWQLTRPMARHPQDTPEARLQEADALLAIRRQLTPELDGTHMIRADKAEECMYANSSSFMTRVFWNLAPVYSYQEWLNNADKSGKYREYREYLHLFQAAYPGKRLVMKAPDHVDGLSELLDAIPTAMVVRCHRDIVEQFGSYMSLGRVTRKIAVNHVDVARVANTVHGMTKASIERSNAAASAHPDRIIDLSYTDMMRDPAGQVQRVYQHFGLTLSDTRLREMREHHLNNPKGQHGEHRYALSEFGMDEADVRQRYADYEARYLR
jgi:hypothetical protein